MLLLARDARRRGRAATPRRDANAIQLRVGHPRRKRPFRPDSPPRPNATPTARRPLPLDALDGSSLLPEASELGCDSPEGTPVLARAMTGKPALPCTLPQLARKLSLVESISCGEEHKNPGWRLRRPGSRKGLEQGEKGKKGSALRRADCKSADCDDYKMITSLLLTIHRDCL